MSPVFAADDPDAQRYRVETTAQRRARIEAYKKTATPAQARDISAQKAAYPHLGAGTAVPLGVAGVRYDDPVAEAAATAAAKKQTKSRGWMGPIGNIVSAPVHALNAVGDVASHALKPALRTGAAVLSAPFEAGTALIGNIASEAGEFAAGAISGAATGAAVGAMGFNPFTPIAGAVVGGLTGGTLGALAQSKDVVKGNANWNIAAQTTLGASIGERGMGQGYLPGGTAAEEAARRRRAAASVGEHAFTPGRLLAGSVFEPDSLAFRTMSGAVDLSLALKADPSDLALTKVSHARKAARGFTEAETGLRSLVGVRGAKELQELTPEAERVAAGLVGHGYRPTVITNNALNWLTSSKKGQALVEHLVKTDDFEKLRRGLKGVSAETVLALKEAKSADEAIAVLLPRASDSITTGGDALRNARRRRLTAMLDDPMVDGEAKKAIQGAIDDISKDDVARGLGYENGLTEKIMAPRIQKNGVVVKTTRKLGQSRLFAEMPGSLDFTDADGAIDNAVNLMRASKISPEDISRHSEAMARAFSTGDIPAARRAFFEPFVGEGGVLMREGIDAPHARKFKNMLLSSMDDVERRAHYERVTGVPVTGLEIAGDTTTIPHAGLLADLLKQTTVPIDQKFVRQLRRSTASLPGPDLVTNVLDPKLQKVLMSKKWDMGVGTLDWLTSKAWKPFALLRGAYTVRVIAEEQIRMANSGVSSMFAHPLSYLAWAATDDGGKLGNLLKSAGVDVGRGDIDLLGQKFTEAEAGVEKLLRGQVNEYARGIGRKQMLDHWMPGRSLQRASNQAAYKRGDEHYTRALHERIVELHEDPIARRVANGGLLLEDAPPSAGQGTLEWWINHGSGRDTLRDIEKHVGHIDPDQALERTRKWVADATGGTHVPSPTPGAGAPLQMSSPGDVRIRNAIAQGEIDGVPLLDADGKLNKAFTRKLDDVAGEGAGPFSVTGSDYTNPTIGEHYNKAVEGFFNFFMGKRTATLSRSPHFRQYYWRDAAEMATELNKADQGRMLAMMGEAELPASYRKAVQDAVARGSGELSLGQVDTLLKGRALDATRDLLYDVSKRGQLSDVMRIIWPFAESQREVLKTWAKIGTESPQTLRKAQKMITAARGDVVGTQDGFFYKDPQTGEEMFAFPGSELLVKGFTGVNAALTGNVAGLSMFGSGLMPGVGPTVQVAASAILPHVPEFDEIRDLIDPMGTGDAATGIEDFFVPSWAKKLVTAKAGDEGDRVFANQVKEVWRAGVASGRYSTDTLEEVQDGLEHARSQARKLYLIRGMAQLMGAPTAPSVEMMAKDPDGKWQMAGQLAEDYQAFMKAEPETADENFLARYGDNAFAYMQPLTRTTGVIAGATKDAGLWVRKNASLVKDYPDVYGFLAPQGEEFDSRTYLAQIKSGERISLSPAEFAAQSKDRQAKLILYAQKDRFGPYPSKPQRDWLHQLREALREEYPGFDQHLSLPEKLRPKEKVEEVARMVADPRLEGNPIAESVRTYLQAKASVDEQARAAGYADVNQPKAVAGARAWLRQLGEALIEENPDFSVVWDRILSRELIDDDVAAPEEVAISG